MVHGRKLASRELTVQVHVVRVNYKMRFGELSSKLQVVSRVGHPLCNRCTCISARLFMTDYHAIHDTERGDELAYYAQLQTHPSPSGSRSAHIDGDPPYSSFVICLSPSLSCSAIHYTADKRVARCQEASGKTATRVTTTHLARLLLRAGCEEERLLFPKHVRSDDPVDVRAEWSLDLAS